MFFLQYCYCFIHCCSITFDLAYIFLFHVREAWTEGWTEKPYLGKVRDLCVCEVNMVSYIHTLFHILYNHFPRYYANCLHSNYKKPQEVAIQGSFKQETWADTLFNNVSRILYLIQLAVLHTCVHARKSLNPFIKILRMK
jgi:hypothetical protein